jgi:ribonuclease BN (tRNA processing enzyme)
VRSPSSARRPAWPNPGGAHSGYLVEATAPCSSRLRARRARRLREREPWPQVDAIAITHFHLDHWGDLVPWVWGSFYREGTTTRARALGLPGRPRVPRGARRRGSASRTCSSGRSVVREYDAETAFTTAAVSTCSRCGSRTTSSRPTASGSRTATTTLAYTGDTGPSERIAELARDVDLLVCEATLATGDADGQPRGHLSVDEALDAYRASGARRLLLTHRPAELSLPEGLDLAYDGMEVEIEPAA